MFSVLMAFLIAISASGAWGFPSPQPLAPGPQLPLPAFPGAEGHGAQSSGGRGGRVIEVTTLEDAIPAPQGSFRAALEASGPRTVVFRVGGIIELKRRLVISNPFITIAGQTAPGDGILITGVAGIGIQTHDVIIRYLRVRLSGEGRPSSGQLPFGILNGSSNVILDHCSASWSLDKVLVSKDADRGNGDISDITIQRCIISESLHPHSTGLLITGTRDYGVNPAIEDYLDVKDISVHHNLFAHNSHRNPRTSSAGTEVINNVVYNWKARVGSSVAKNTVDIVNNYWKPGPMSNTSKIIFHESRHPVTGVAFPDPSIYMSGNIVEGLFADPAQDNWQLITEAPRNGGGPLPDSYRRLTRMTPAPIPVSEQTAQEAYQAVMVDVGMNMRLDCLGRWVEAADSVDIRVMADVVNGTGWRELPPLSPAEAGGFPVIAGGAPCADADHDGMPDEWEQLHGFDPGGSSDGTADADDDGYTNLEEFLNGSAPSSAPDTSAALSPTRTPAATPVIATSQPTSATPTITVKTATPVVLAVTPTPPITVTPISPSEATGAGEAGVSLWVLLAVGMVAALGLSVLAYLWWRGAPR